MEMGIIEVSSARLAGVMPSSQPRTGVDFSDLRKWRLSQGEGAVASAREVLGRVPLRNSTRQDFIPTRFSERCAKDIRKLIEEGIPRAGLATRSGDKS